MSFEENMAMELNVVERLADNADFTEGIDAFLNKRAPRWSDG
jgi:enoyl-CoA hydratase/carnithine racemase